MSERRESYRMTVTSQVASVKVATAKNGKPYAKWSMRRMGKKRDDDSWANLAITCLTFDQKIIDRIASVPEKQDHVTVEGDCKYDPWKGRDGEVQQVTIFVDGMTAPTTSAAAPPPPMPDDDIPF